VADSGIKKGGGDMEASSLGTDCSVSLKEIALQNVSNEVSHFGGSIFLVFEMGGRELAFLSCKN